MEKTSSSLIPTIYAESVDEFLNLISKRNEIWHENNAKENFWIYRGQWEGSGKLFSLLPSSLRKNKTYQQVKEKILAESSGELYPIDSIARNITKNLKKARKNKKGKRGYKNPYEFYLEQIPEKTRKYLENIIVQSMVELMLLQRFIATCNKSALYIDNSHVTIEYKIFDRSLSIKEEEAKVKLYEIAEEWLGKTRFSESVHSNSYQPFFNYTNYYPLALAQHSGIPSRLLDWTYSPLIAAFFAIPQSFQSDKGEICVYAFNMRYQRDSLTYRNSLRIHANTKQHRFDFLHAQKGIFTEMRGADFYYLKYGKWPSLDEHILEFDEYAADTKDISNLKKIVLDGKFADELRNELAEEDIVKSALMPTYFHCAEQVMEK